MKTILVLFGCSICLLFCTTRAEQKGSKTMAVSTIDTIDFKTMVQPILQKKCTPCHFPGGKMYERMPFDQGKTIIDFKDKIVKRIKDEQDLAVISKYISQH